MAEVEAGGALHAVAAAEVVVAVDDVVIVRQATAQEDAAQMDALANGHQVVQAGKAVGYAGTDGGCLGNLVGYVARAVGHFLGIEVVEILEEADHQLHVGNGGELPAPQTSHEVDAADKGLVARKAEGQAQGEVVVGLVVLSVEGGTVDAAQLKVGVVLATEEAAAVGQVTVAHAYLKGHRQAVVVVVEVALGTYAPGFAGEQAVEGTRRTEDAGGQLAQETGKAATAVVEQQGGHTEGDLAQSDAAQSGGHEVVDGGWLYLGTGFPHQAAGKGVGGGLPEVHAAGTGGVEVEVAVVGMGKEVGGELVVVPHEAVLDVVLDGGEADFGKVFLHDVTVEGPHADVEPEGFDGGTPRMFAGGRGEDGGRFPVGGKAVGQEGFLAANECGKEEEAKEQEDVFSHNGRKKGRGCDRDFSKTVWQEA